jgi:hypothetical protein
MPTWTYGYAPSTSTPDAVRFLVGQTSTADPVLVYDEEITFAIAQRPTAYGAASLVADVMAGKYTNQAQRLTVGALTIAYQNRAEEYRTLSRRLMVDGALAGVSLYVGGISQSDMLVDIQNTDRVPMPFAIGMNDNPRVMSFPSTLTGS